jgi:hypothetical protein
MSPNPNKNILQECADCGSSSNLNLIILILNVNLT